MSVASADGISSARIEDMARVMLRPLASPVPLGFLALGIGSCLLTALQLGWIAPSTTPQVALAVLTMVVPLELLSAVFAFLIRDVVMSTGLGLLTGTWAAVGTLLLDGRPGGTSPVVGILALAVGVALLVPAAAASWSKPVAAVIMAVAAARFVMIGIYQLGAGGGWQTASGVVGVVLLATAAYGSLALAMEDARHRAVLPVNRRGTSRAAMSGQLERQLETLATEAGVRQES